jgi:hypothetical protein
LIWELLNATFFEFAQKEKGFPKDSIMPELLKLKPYFELYHDAKEALDDVSQLCCHSNISH